MAPTPPRPLQGTQWWLKDQGASRPVQGASPVRIGVSSTQTLNASPAYQALKAKYGQTGFGNAELDTLAAAQRGVRPAAYTQPRAPAGPQGPGGGSRGGGGGGGAPAPPTFDAGWLADLLSRGRPGAVAATNVDLPEWQGQFNPAMYNELEGRFNTAVGQSRTAAGQAYDTLGQYLNNNYRNAFAQGAPQSQAPGQDQLAMQRMMQAQGVNPALAGAQQEGAAAGNAAFANLWALLGANEDTNQRNRLNNLQTMRNVTNQGIDAASLQGLTGIGLQRGQAQSAYEQMAQQYNNQMAQQEAMANWERGNQVTDLNASNTNSYVNAQMQALMGLLPSLTETRSALPDLNAIFGARA